MTNQCYFDDCYNILPSVHSQSIDLVFTDPPYGVTAAKWDEQLDISRFWTEINRVIKPNGVVAVFAAQPFTSKLICSNLGRYKYCWYWVKNQGTNFFHAKRMPIRKVEEICIFGGSTYFPQMSDGHTPTNSAKGCHNGKVYHGTNIRDYKGGSTVRYPDNILDFKCVNNYARKHPNQKPIDLCEYIIQTYTVPGDTVLDCFAGVGTVGLACKNLRRQFICIENNQEYFDIMSRVLYEP